MNPDTYTERTPMFIAMNKLRTRTSVAFVCAPMASCERFVCSACCAARLAASSCSSARRARTDASSWRSLSCLSLRARHREYEEELEGRDAQYFRRGCERYEGTSSSKRIPNSKWYEYVLELCKLKNFVYRIFTFLANFISYIRCI